MFTHLCTLLGDKQEVKVDWAEIWFFNGSKYNTHCNKLNRTARIVFVCDKNQGDNVSTMECVVPVIVYDIPG